ncbi:hypothetical protein VNO77_01507 [Canavalia gladiata]|uniref:C2H2-type domain-containing protein n=1 Tax=Canavalia gladiata TaxID=3824 RepID=A0AAN9MT83_CANGL
MHCRFCGFIFSPLFARAHRVLHRRKDRVQCDRCGVCFHSQPHLNNHLNVCTQSSSAQSSNVSHMQQPLNVDPSHQSARHRRIMQRRKDRVRCGKCGIHFYSQTQLDSHMNVCGKPSNVPPLQCDQCDRTFQSSRQLSNHRRIHKKSSNAQPSNIPPMQQLPNEPFYDDLPPLCSIFEDHPPMTWQG